MGDLTVNEQKFMPINPEIVTWARTRAGFTIEEAEVSLKKIRDWELGDAMPTYPQLEAMASRFKCPIAVFFFPDPPRIENINTSFRTITNDRYETIPRNVRTMIRKAKAMQYNLIELQEGVSPNRLITRDLGLSPDVDVIEFAGLVRKYLGVSIDNQQSWKSIENALEKWRAALADVGVFVFKDRFQQGDHFGFCPL